jgi:geranylgeranyl pyrophosphate synthase
MSRKNLLLDRLELQFSPTGLNDLLGLEAGNVPADLWENCLLGPLRDFLSRPAKSLRAELVEATWQLSGGSGPAPPLLSTIVELVHAGSLIIDDIEDEALERRGRPALHLIHGTPLALNAGNWLWFWAEQLIEGLDLDVVRELAIRRCLSRTLLRCHHGQALDLAARVTTLPQAQIPGVVAAATELKTGALMEFTARLTALVASAPAARVELLATVGRKVGVVLQMLDDLGSITSEARWNKGKEDLLGAHPTWPWAWLASDLDPEAFSHLQIQARDIRGSDEAAHSLAEAMRERLGPRGHERIEALVASTMTMLRQGMEDAASAAAAERIFRRMRDSYG